MFIPPQFGPTVGVGMQSCTGCALCLACLVTPTPDFEMVLVHCIEALQAVAGRCP